MRYSIGGRSLNLITNLGIHNSRMKAMSNYSSKKNKSKSILRYIKVSQISRLQGTAASELFQKLKLCKG